MVETPAFSGGGNRLMVFDPGEGDRIGGVSRPYMNAEGKTQQVGDHLAIYFRDSPWDGDGPGTPGSQTPPGSRKGITWRSQPRAAGSVKVRPQQAGEQRPDANVTPRYRYHPRHNPPPGPIAIEISER